jgi:hypothetical protein
MKNRLFAFLVVQLSIAAAFSQRTTQHLDLSGSAGSGWGSGSLSYNYNWLLGKSKKFELGAGARFTSYFGSNQYYVTAPAKLTSGGSGPGVLFRENIVANLDSFLLASSQVNSLNLSVNFGYRITKKFSAGVNIDAIGFSFGGSQSGKYVNGTSVVNNITAKPTGFNLLLVSDNDLGSLSSEAFAAYKFNSKWSVKAGIQFLFAEYTTNTKVQQLPEPNDRFRYKATGVVIGVRYQLK